MNDPSPLDGGDDLSHLLPAEILGKIQRDFRGPIALIEQCGELLAGSDLEPEDREAVLSILRDTARHLRERLDRYTNFPK